MKTEYTTLAAARMADPEKFDGDIRNAVFAAAGDVGPDVVIRALCGHSFYRTDAAVLRPPELGNYCE